MNVRIMNIDGIRWAFTEAQTLGVVGRDAQFALVESTQFKFSTNFCHWFYDRNRSQVKLLLIVANTLIKMFPND